MSNCIPCPPCESDIPLTCEPYGTVSVGNRVVVEDDAFCTKTLATPTEPSTLVWDNEVKWQKRNTFANLPTYANNAAAIAGGLVGNDIYKTATGELRIVV
jgi:hypothetical protein